MNNKDKHKYIFVGLDLHKETHTLVAIDSYMEELTFITFDNKPSEFEVIIKELKKVAKGREIVFGLEDIGGNGRSFAQFAVGEGYITKEVNAALAEGYRKGNVQFKKNDVDDAKCVSIMESST